MGSFKDKLVQAGVISPAEAAKSEARMVKEAQEARREAHRLELQEAREDRTRLVAPFREKVSPARRPAAEVWCTFRESASGLGFDWAFGTIPPSLPWKWSRGTPKALREVDITNALPPAYSVFVEAVGYPAFVVNDVGGLSFLPPLPMAAMSADVSDDENEVEKRTKTIRYRFFAGYDFSDIEGWAFSSEKDEPSGLVWLVESSMARGPLGFFDDWLAHKTEALLARLQGLSPGEIAGSRELHDPDFHRLVEYSKGSG